MVVFHHSRIILKDIATIYQDYVLRVSHNSKNAGIGNPIVELAYSGLL